MYEFVREFEGFGFLFVGGIGIVMREVNYMDVVVCIGVILVVLSGLWERNWLVFFDKYNVEYVCVYFVEGEKIL